MIGLHAKEKAVEDSMGKEKVGKGMKVTAEKADKKKFVQVNLDKASSNAESALLLKSALALTRKSSKRESTPFEQGKVLIRKSPQKPSDSHGTPRGSKKKTPLLPISVSSSSKEETAHSKVEEEEEASSASDEYNDFDKVEEVATEGEEA